MFTCRPFTFVASCLLLLALAWPAGAQAQDTSAAPQDTSVQQTPAPEAAKQAADDWLALVDADNYEQSWEEASPLLKELVSKEQWAGAVNRVQQQFGTLQSRSLETAHYTTELPRAPEGEYVVAQYHSAFEKRDALEVVILAKEDGTWLVAGYFARPDALLDQSNDS